MQIAIMKSPIAQFYQEHLPDGVTPNSILTAECPFCKREPTGKKGKIIVFLNPNSLFFGYFRCSVACVEGGFPQWFAELAGIDNSLVPGHIEEELVLQDLVNPPGNINAEIDDFSNKLEQEQLGYFDDANLGASTLQQLKIGYNGRYLVYPYFQMDGNVYSARCVNPRKHEDYFWYGDTSFAAGTTGLFNVEEIRRCAGGALFLCEGEENLLTVKQLGFPGSAYFENTILENIDPQIFAALKTLFIVPRNTVESMTAARLAASKIGFKVRILKWDLHCPRDYTIFQFAIDSSTDFAKNFGEMIVASKPFSPFAAPKKEFRQFFTTLAESSGEEYSALISGFDLLDDRINGIHGINILGGGPKVGKSCFMIQMATEMAARRVPVLYYDFENGRQRIYQRTFSRMSRIETSRLQPRHLAAGEKERYSEASRKFEKLLGYFRVINDRKVSPELMRRHIDFLRHETRNDYTVVVIDSLHKLPFKDLSEMRSGIDSWLRQMESIRDELNVSFLVASELSRGTGGSYDEEPHMGVFKGSGDIEYSADNAMVLLPKWNHMKDEMMERVNMLWLVGSREHSPGLIGNYVLDYPYWGFREEAPLPLR